MPCCSQHFGPYFSSFLPHSYGFEPAKELKFVLKLLDFASAYIVGQPPCEKMPFADRKLCIFRPEEPR